MNKILRNYYLLRLTNDELKKRWKQIAESNVESYEKWLISTAATNRTDSDIYNLQVLLTLYRRGLQ